MKKRLCKFTSMVLAVMLLLSCFAPMTLAAEKTEADVGASNYTVYFDDQANLYNYGDVYCYMWNESTTGANAEWPGKKMSYDNSTGYYYYNSTVKYERCIFSVGNGDPNYYYGQTYNLDACYGYVYICDDVGASSRQLKGAWKEYNSDPYVDIGSYSIYMKNSANWSYSGDTMYLYAWNDSGSVIGVWPGVKMTNLGNGIYKYTTTIRYDNCIFSEGGDSSYDHQSPDMTARYGYIYDNASYSWELYETPPTTAPVTTVAPTTVPPTTVAPTTVVPTTVVPTTEPVQKYVNIFGDINLDLVNDGTDVYSGTVELEAGSYSFKVDENGTQMCFGYTFTDSMSNVTYSSTYTSATTLNATGGYYTFKYNSTTDRLSVSYVPYPTEEVTTPITEPVTTEEPTEAPTTIPVTEPTEPITTVPVTEPTEQITTAPVTEPITTEPITDPVKDELTVNATSNLFTSQTATYNNRTRELTVTYYIDAEKDMLNTQWELTYDPTVLSVSKDKNTADTVCPEFKGNSVLTVNDGNLKFNTYKLSLFDISSEEKVFAKIVFDVNNFNSLKVDETTINLNVIHLTLSKLDESMGISDMAEEVRVVYNGNYDDSYGLINTARTEMVNVEIPEFIGDADGSGIIDIHDATLIAKYLAEYIELDEGQLLVSDCDGDGVVTVKDVTCIQLYIADAVNSGNTGDNYIVV